MKAKFLGIVVIGVLALSILATTAGAVSQVISEGTTVSHDGLEKTSLSRSDSQASSSKDGALIGTLKFVCPFH